MACIIKEQRTSKRTNVSWPVSVWHPKASKFYNARSVDISKGGALISMSMQAPVREGQDIEVNFPRNEDLAKQKGSFARIKTAKVVRIDRSDIIRSSAVRVGLRFNESVEEVI
ncbi:MAG: PilZ domain-containing protein [Phycisphaerae bacterium]|nr:PilZ domain-containing protein [Phycisphaerae bacterium]